MFEVEGPFENLNFTNNKSEEKAVVFFQFVIPRDVYWNSIRILLESLVNWHDSGHFWETQILCWNSFTGTILFGDGIVIVSTSIDILKKIIQFPNLLEQEIKEDT